MMPFGKIAIAAISLIPINLHIMASVSYDVFTFGGIMLIFAYIMKIGFDNDKYLKIQSEQIKKRISQFGDKLYLEQLIDASLQVKVIDAKKGVLQISNISDIEFQALFGNRMNPVLFRPRTAIRITIPKGTVLDFINCYAGRQTVKKEIW